MEPAPRRPGCFLTALRAVAAGVVFVILAGLGITVWDAWQLRKLRPPADPTFEGFLRDGRKGHLSIDSRGERLYWTTGQGTIVRYSESVVYEFDRSGVLVNWTPGTDNFEGMILNRPVRRTGVEATLEEARAWMRRK